MVGNVDHADRTIPQGLGSTGSNVNYLIIHNQSRTDGLFSPISPRSVDDTPQEETPFYINFFLRPEPPAPNN